jgi:RNA polymerase sigma-54 factor
MAMAAGIRLELRQSQGLVLTPQLQQAIRLLQLSNLELSAVVDREVAENPFLDRLDAGAAQGRAADGAAAADGPEAAPPSAPSRPAGAADGDDGGWWQPPAGRPADCALGLRRAGPGGRGQDGELPSLEARLTRPRGLREHLLEQLAAAREVEARALAALLIDCLDQDGYLREADADLAAMLGAGAERVAAARALLQSCDPAGVAARDLAECLALQLRERDRLDPAMRALLDNLPLLARADLAELTRRCGVDAEDLQDMVQELKRLEPRPARAFGGEEPLAVIPDVVVSRERGGAWRVELNTGTLPRVLVDRAYHAEISSQPVGVDRRARDYLNERLQAASWLAKALDQRARTMLRVSRAVFAKQRPFLDRGPSALRPLVLRDIAEVTGLHESTVSRATADKYAATPHGTFPLKFFFTTAIAAAAAGEEAHSAEALRQQIRRLVEREDPKDVLSDDQIVAELRRMGAVLARRTVAKYRESLGIPSSVERRRAKALGR